MKSAFPDFDHSFKFYRNLTAGGGLVYLVWWGFVEILLPGSYNPLGSRLAVVAYCGLIFAGIIFLPKMAQQAPKWFQSCLWLITGHYFYLFYFNQADINWVVGSYITIIAGCACIRQKRELMTFSAWITALSVALVILDPALFKTIFLPGVFTILTFSYLSLRSQFVWLEKSHETSQRFQNLFDAVFEGVVVHENGIVVESNEAFASLLGYEHGEVVGRDVIEFIAPEFRTFAQSRVDQMIDTPYQVNGLRKDGSVIPIEIRGKKHFVGKRMFRLAAVSDLTDRIKREQERVLYEASQHALKMREEFLSIASHELKTPLTNIKLQTQVALRGMKKEGQTALQSEKMKKFIEQTDRQADRLTKLVEEMLDVSRISTGKLSIEPTDFDLSQLVKEVVSTFEVSFRQSGITVRIQVPGICRVYADRQRLEQVISNLLSNAVKYGGSNPVSIELIQAESETRLTVQDEGIGISAENQERIFQRFERAISSHKISGLGLGLYIAKDIVERHGGRIEVQSEPQRGARFTVVLPRTGIGGVA